MLLEFCLMHVVATIDFIEGAPKKRCGAELR